MVRFILLLLCLNFILLFGSVSAQQQPRDAQANNLRVRERLLAQLSVEDPWEVTLVLDRLELSSETHVPLVMSRIIELTEGSLVEQRLAAIRCLEPLGPNGKPAIEALERRLSDTNAEVRVAAAIAVWKIAGHSERTVPVLLDGLKSDDKGVSRSASNGLSIMESDGAGAATGFVKLLADRRGHVRANSARAIGGLGPEVRQQCEELLQRALDDSSLVVRIESAKAIHLINGSLEKAVPVLASIVEMEPGNEVPSKQEIPPGNSPPILAAEALGEIGPDAAPATEALAKALDSPRFGLRLVAASALGRIGPAARESIPALSKALRETQAQSYPLIHRVWRVSDNAAEALTAIGVEAIPVLIDALEDDDPVVRVNACRALGGNTEAATQALQPLAHRFGDSHPLVRIEAVKAVGAMNSIAKPIAPQLAKLLLDNQAFTSYRSGGGIGHHESVRAETLKALLEIQPSAESIAPEFARAMANASEISYESIAMLRAIEGDFQATTAPLEKLLSSEETQVGAACALAFVKPETPELQSTLTDGLFSDKSLHSLAAMGLGRLTESGHEIDPALQRRWFERAKTNGDLVSLANLFRTDPTNPRVTETLIERLRSAHSVFDAIGIREAELALIDRAAVANVKRALINELTWHPEAPRHVDDEDLLFDEFVRQSEQAQVRFQFAKILIAAEVEVGRALNCIQELLTNRDASVEFSIANALVNCASERQTAIELLSQLVEKNSTVIVGGDFYGNGGEAHRVGDRAVETLATLEAKATLESFLTHHDPEVRIRVISALSKFGQTALSEQLLGCIHDSDPRVRRAVVSTLGLIGDATPTCRGQLRPILTDCLRDDHRRSVRAEADRVLTDWK